MWLRYGHELGEAGFQRILWVACNALTEYVFVDVLVCVVVGKISESKTYHSLFAAAVRHKEYI